MYTDHGVFKALFMMTASEVISAFRERFETPMEVGNQLVDCKTRKREARAPKGVLKLQAFTLSLFTDFTDPMIVYDDH